MEYILKFHTFFPITAAHCTVELNGALTHAVIGTHCNGRTTNGETITIKQQIVHPKYNRNTNSNDFAIYHLASNAKTAPVIVSFDTVATSEQKRGKPKVRLDGD
ncbi:unnamed protein product [Aphanomyces euteiches]